ncbi:M56 family metallopeptidase [Flavobacterium profundi]|nr:M56 family metallopeptidase [Flavobacterium profundi]
MLNRFYLLGSVLFSFVVPLVPIYDSKDRLVEIQLNEIIVSNFKRNVIDNFMENEFKTSQIFFTIYLLGILVFMSLFLMKIFKIWRIKKGSKKIIFNSTKIYLVEHSSLAFTFLNSIFIGNHNHEFEVIVKHELIHRIKKHSFDLLLLEIIKVLYWFNPLVIVFQNRLIEVHEFEADALAVQQDKVRYFESLLTQVFKVQNWSFTNSFFNQSLIKKRIFMLQKSQSSKEALYKYGLIIPMMIFSIMFFSRCVDADESTVKKSEESSFINDEVSSLQKNDAKVPSVSFESVDETPRFVNCENIDKDENSKCFNDQMNLHIMKNFTYPDLALEKNIEGTVVVQFIIDKEGNVINVEARGPENGALLEKEAIRLMLILPKFIPAKLKGERVNVKYGLPITFKLK